LSFTITITLFADSDRNKHYIPDLALIVDSAVGNRRLAVAAAPIPNDDQDDAASIPQVSKILFHDCNRHRFHPEQTKGANMEDLEKNSPFLQ
jgi:hypothetical protein